MLRKRERSVTYTTADEPMARMPEVAREKVFLARYIHCCPNFSRPNFIF
jgi:hypothetical protein